MQIRPLPAAAGGGLGGALLTQLLRQAAVGVPAFVGPQPVAPSAECEEEERERPPGELVGDLISLLPVGGGYFLFLVGLCAVVFCAGFCSGALAGAALTSWWFRASFSPSKARLARLAGYA